MTKLIDVDATDLNKEDFLDRCKAYPYDDFEICGNCGDEY